MTAVGTTAGRRKSAIQTEFQSHDSTPPEMTARWAAHLAGGIRARAHPDLRASMAAGGLRAMSPRRVTTSCGRSTCRKASVVIVRGHDGVIAPSTTFAGTAATPGPRRWRLQVALHLQLSRLDLDQHRVLQGLTDESQFAGLDKTA